MSKFRRLVSVALGVTVAVILGVRLWAALLGITTGLPRATWSNPSSITYTASTGALAVSATPAVVQFSGTPLPPLAFVTSGSLAINIQLNADGSINTISPNPGDDLVFRGKVTGPGPTIYDGTGANPPLLTGEISQFGFADGGSVDLYDMRFTVTGGQLASYFSGQDLGVTISSDNPTTFTGSFAVNFGGNAKGNLGPIPPVPTPSCSASIGNFVWHDLNHNGIQDAGEDGIDGVPVTLTPVSPAGSSQTVNTGLSPTGQHGYYQFSNLCAGSYSVSAATPTGYTPTIANAPGSTTDTDSNGSPASVSLPTSSSSDQSIDFGFQTPCTGSIGDFVWNDLNANGIQDANELGVNNVTVELLDANGNVIASTVTANSPSTGAAGFYQFDGLCAGSYKVRVTRPSTFDSFSPAFAGSDTTKDSNANASTGIADVTLAGDDATDATIDIGLVPPCSGLIGDFVWNDLNGNGIQDEGEPGLDGVLVVLSDSTGPIAQTYTTTVNGKAGYYEFHGVCGGNYTVTVTRPSSYTQISPALQGSDTTVDSNGAPSQNGAVSIATVTLPEYTTVDRTIDFGFYACSGTIGNFVWQDLNGNGIQDANEPGIPNVTVELEDGPGAPIVTRITDASGFYQFSGLCAGTYQVKVLSGVPSGYTPTVTGAGTAATDSNLTPSVVVLDSDFDSDDTVDFGYYQPVTIGNFVWLDANANGIQDGGEAGIAGVNVTLSGTDGSGNAVSQTIQTDVNGYYTFTEAPGTYTVSIATPAGYFTSPTGQGTSATDSNVTPSATAPTTLASGQSDDTIDFGFYRKASIGNFVWKDLNANGIQDAGEPGIDGVTVNLLDGINNNVIDTQQTSGGGAYLFSGLTPGNYRVQFVTPTGYLATGANQGANDALDSDAVSGVSGLYTLTSGEYNDTVDAGFYEQIDLSLTKTVNNATPNLGTNVTFTLTLSNAGPSTATGVTVKDVLPAGLTYVSSTAAQGSYNSSTGIWTVGTLNASASTTLQITATAATVGTKVNYAQVASANQADVDSTPNNNAGPTPVEDDEAAASVTPKQIDLSLTKTVNNATPNVGTNVTFTLTLSNAGPSTATGVTVKDVLPTGLSYVSSVAAQGSYSSSTGIWTVGTLTSGGSTTLQITATVTSLGAKTNFAQVQTANEPDVDSTPGNNSTTEDDDDSVTVTPPQIDLSLTKTVNNTTPNVGTNVTFTLTLSNAGPSTATGVTVKDVLPTGLSYVSSVAAQGSYSSSTGIWTVGTLNSGAGTTLQLTATVTSLGTKTNYAQVQTANETDIDSTPGNNSTTEDDDDSVTVTPPQIDLSLTKRVNNTSPAVGTNVTFTIAVTNAGPNTATGVTVKDVLPSGVSYVSSSATQGSYNSGTGIWTIGTLGVNATVSLSIVAQVNVATGTITNYAQVQTADQKDIDSTPGNNSTNEDDDDAVSLTPQKAPYTTYTIGGWGAVPNGNNPATLLAAYFSSLYPKGLIVGGSKTITLTGQLAVQNYLPDGGTPGQLARNYKDPVTTEAGVLGSQVVALKLNVDFSTAGLLPAGLGKLKIAAGYPLAGYTVSQVLSIGNSVLGGAAPPAGMTVSSLNNLLSLINQNYDNALQNLGVLVP